MIIYLKCNCTSKDQQLTKMLIDAGHDVRITKDSRWFSESQKYDVKAPFVVTDEAKRTGVELADLFGGSASVIDNLIGNISELEHGNDKA